MTAEERREYMRKWKLAHPDYYKKYREAHKEEIAIYNTNYYQKYKEIRLAKKRKYYKANRNEITAAKRERYHTDPEYREKVNKYNRHWRRKNYSEDNKRGANEHKRRNKS